MRRESTGRLFGKDEDAVAPYLEHAAARFDQLRFNVQLALDLLRQTGRAGIIVSHGTIFNAHVHDLSSAFILNFRG